MLGGTDSLRPGCVQLGLEELGDSLEGCSVAWHAVYHGSTEAGQTEVAASMELVLMLEVAG